MIPEVLADSAKFTFGLVGLFVSVVGVVLLIGWLLAEHTKIGIILLVILSISFIFSFTYMVRLDLYYATPR